MSEKQLCLIPHVRTAFLCRIINNTAFSIRCMRLFAASRPELAYAQTSGLVAAACLHLITKASRAFMLSAQEVVLPVYSEYLYVSLNFLT